VFTWFRFSAQGETHHSSRYKTSKYTLEYTWKCKANRLWDKSSTPGYQRLCAYIYRNKSLYVDKRIILRGPERILGGQYSYSSDLWSLGIVLHEVATGSFPFPICNAFFDILNTIVKAKSPILDVADGYSQELSNFHSIL